MAAPWFSDLYRAAGMDAGMSPEQAARLAGPAPKAEVITQGGLDRRFKVCRCSRCSLEARCTPSFDFFTRTADETGPLFCEECLLEATGIRRPGGRP